MANNIRKPLALGYIMVRNRSQKEIVEKISTTRSRYLISIWSQVMVNVVGFLSYREIESSFFSNHPVFRNCSPKLYGVSQLAKKLTYLLVNRIKGELVRPLSALDYQVLTCCCLGTDEDEGGA